MNGGDNEVNIPKYTKPKASKFDLYGLTGAFDEKTNTYKASADPQELATMQAVKGIRDSLLKSLGLGGTPEEDPYTKAYMGELLRTSQAPLENALIGRGLGGSTVYKDALTDLMTKASTQSVLGGQQYKMNNLSTLMNYLNTNMGYGQNLLGATTNQYNTDQARAWQQYQDMLGLNLYNANLPDDSMSWLSPALSIAGGVGGFMLGGPPGAMLGSQLGGTAGSMFSGNDNSMDLSSLLGLLPESSIQTQGVSNIANNPFAMQSFNWS